MTREDFVGVVKNAVAGLGFDQDAPMVTFPIDLFLVESDISPMNSAKQAFFDGFTKWRPASDATGLSNVNKITVEASDDESVLEKTNNLFLTNMWGDGLPVVPPTDRKVDWILQGTDRNRHDRLGKFQPRGGIVTVETAAISLAMAGGRPEYLPVVIAATEAVLDPGLEHDKWQSTSANTYPVVIVNGPIAKQIRLNSGFGLMGPNPQQPAGGSIGRALRLMQQNVGGALPGVGTMAIFGSMRYTNAILAEAEDELPDGWLPHGTLRHGYEPGTNSVSVYVATGAANIQRRGTGKETLEDEARQSLRRVATYLQVPNYHYLVGYDDGTPGALVLSPVVARQLAGLGWTQQSIKEFLWEHSKISKELVIEAGLKQWVDTAETERLKSVNINPFAISRSPDNIILLVAGGGHPTHNMWMQGNSWHVVGRKIDAPEKLNDLLVQADADIGCADDVCLI